MKEYVEKFVSTAKEFAGVITDKTVQTVDLGKVEYEIKCAEREEGRAYKALGRLTYQIEQGTLNRDDQIIKAACYQITKIQDKLDDLKKQKQEIKERESRPTAETKASEEEVLKPQKDQDGYVVLKFCPVCKVGNHPDATKCVNCGHSFE
jgi:hypothetical protein